MSKLDKLLSRLLSYPRDFTYNELKTFLLSLGYREIQGAGSGGCFSSDNHKIKLHKPHPGNILKRYQVDLIINELKEKGIIKNE